MMLREEFDKIVLERGRLHPNDPTFHIVWKKMTGLLSRDIEETMKFLDTCTAEEIGIVSEVFDDISEIVNSKEFVACLWELCDKFPDQNLEGSVRFAESYLR